MSPTQAVIIINWKRPNNIGRLVGTASDALPGVTIFVLDHGEGPNKLAGRSDVPLHRCWIRAQPNAGAGARLKLAATMPFEHYLCIDDDTFLSTDQIRALMGKLRGEPDRAHGVTGQLVFRQSDGRIQVRNSVRRPGEISVINQVYAFSRARAQAAIGLAASLGFERWSDVKRGDDILLSSAGPRSSRVHDLGAFEECPTKSADGIATHRSAGFHQLRDRLLKGLLERGALYVVPTSAAHRG